MPAVWSHSILTPLHDWTAALDHLPGGARLADLLWVGLGLVVGWYAYVPVHELLHAGGCALSGCTVETLEIAPQYGAAWLQQWFAFIQVGSDYAGRLSGFDTRGSDLRYLATVALPFGLTVWPGIPLLRSCGRRTIGPRPVHGLVTGFSIPLAFAPLISLPGDYYEMGSIPVSRLAAALGSPDATERWRSDDLPLLVQQRLTDGTILDALGLTGSLLVGLILAGLTYALGVKLDRRLVRAVRR
jgi:hypothetical protein